jgi:putative acetyltransferase
MGEPVVRAEAPGERPAVAGVVAAAFADEGPLIVRLINALDAAGHARASLVAVLDGVVLGHVGLSRSWLDARPRLVEVLVLSPLSVHPDHQGRGLGTRLVAAALAEAATRGAPAVVVEGDPGYYAARGFSPGAAHGFQRPSRRIPEAAFQVALLADHEDWMRGAVVYADPFWRLDCVGLRDPLLGRIERELAADP